MTTKNGNKEWHPNITKQYSKKAESLQDRNLLKNPKVSKNFGKNGPLAVSTFKNYVGNTPNLLSAFDEIGIKIVDELNSANLLGAGVHTATAVNGRRESTAKAYLNPYQKRKNLKILKNTLATKVLIKNETKKAYGVAVKRHGNVKQIFYSKLEVIISAGSYNTPKLLMLSGVGPQKVLESHKINCVVNSPGVGQNLQDHPLVTATIYGDAPKKEDELEKAFNAVHYLYDNTGNLSVSNALNVIAFYPLNTTSKHPDFEIALVLFPINSSAVGPMLSPYKTSLRESVLANTANHALYNFVNTVLIPFSRGYVSLKSSDPKDPPIIRPNYFNDPRDLEKVALGMQMFTKIVNTIYFKSINGYLGRMKFEDCDGFELNSLDYWKCIAKSTVSPLQHPVSTAKMGPRSDPEAVVDSRLRVYSVEGLRVVDAGVMPTTTSCNTNGPTIMVAERASDLIKEDNSVA